MSQYLTFTDYQNLGGKLEQVAFTRQEYAARMKIDTMTFNRFRDEEPAREVLSRLVFELIERGYCAIDGKEITSMSEGELSVSYGSSQGKAESLIREYLSGETVSGIPVFYCGN
jgi:hypothetical protein